MNDRILIVGKGFIGSRLRGLLQCESTSSKIHSLAEARKLLKRHNPLVLINCIGFTGQKNVDGCELDKDKALFLNSYIPLILAEACLRAKVKMVHISSGCIYHYDYDRDKPIQEERLPDFFELYYSRTKIYAERALYILSQTYNILIIRIRIPLDNQPHPRNILTKLIHTREVINIPNSITYIPDFIKAIQHLLKIDARGIYNVVNRGSLQYPELMDVYKRHNPKFNYEVIDYKKLNLVRTNLILSTRKLEKDGFKIRNIHEVLEECVREYVEYSLQAGPAS